MASAGVTGGKAQQFTRGERRHYSRGGRRRYQRGRSPALPEGATAGVTGEGEL